MKTKQTVTDAKAHPAMPEQLIDYLAYNGAMGTVVRDTFRQLNSLADEEKEQFVQQLSPRQGRNYEEVMSYWLLLMISHDRVSEKFGVRYSVEAQPSAYKVTMDTPAGKFERTVPIRAPNELYNCVLDTALKGQAAVDYLSKQLAAPKGGIRGGIEKVLQYLR